LQERPQVEAGSSGDDWEPATVDDFGCRSPCQPQVIAGGKRLAGVSDVNKVVRNLFSHLGRRFS
jgi:hypothetical protein